MGFMAKVRAWRARAVAWVSAHRGTVVIIGACIAAYVALRLTGRVLGLIL